MPRGVIQTFASFPKCGRFLNPPAKTWASLTKKYTSLYRDMNGFRNQKPDNTSLVVYKKPQALLI